MPTVGSVSLVGTIRARLGRRSIRGLIRATARRARSGAHPQVVSWRLWGVQQLDCLSWNCPRGMLRDIEGWFHTLPGLPKLAVLPSVQVGMSLAQKTGLACTQPRRMIKSLALEDP